VTHIIFSGLTATVFRQSSKYYIELGIHSEMHRSSSFIAVIKKNKCKYTYTNT